LVLGEAEQDDVAKCLDRSQSNNAD